MVSLKFFALIVVIAAQATNANFLSFLEAHQKRIISLFNFSNNYLHDTRSIFHDALLGTSNATTNHFIEVYGGLRSQEASTQQRLDQATNSTCVQNLRNVIGDTLSLAGFRIGTCSNQFAETFVTIADTAYRQINDFQMASHTLPIFFMAEMQGENVLIDPNTVMARIDVRYAVKWDFLATQMPTFRQSMGMELSGQLNGLNTVLAACFSDILGNFRSVAASVEERITTICGQ